LISTTDVELLKQAWRNEKAAPEILRFESDLINRVKGQIDLMVTFQKLITFLLFVISYDILPTEMNFSFEDMGIKFKFFLSTKY